VGAQPFEGFSQVIDEELEGTASAMEPAAARKKSEP
jgi:hypothetical protein